MNDDQVDVQGRAAAVSGRKANQVRREPGQWDWMNPNGHQLPRSTKCKN